VSRFEQKSAEKFCIYRKILQSKIPATPHLQNSFSIDQDLKIGLTHGVSIDTGVEKIQKSLFNGLN
jgi:hypothetical protein